MSVTGTKRLDRRYLWTDAATVVRADREEKESEENESFEFRQTDGRIAS